MPKKVHKLDGNQELPFALIAISSSDNLLKMAWNINRILAISLKEYDYQIPSKDDPSLYFPVLCDRESSTTLYFSLIPNKQLACNLIKELTNIDYILEISGEINKSIIAEITKQIKQIQGVIMVLEVSPEKVKRKNAFYPA